MSVLIWLLGIPVSAIAAACWAMWRSRPRGPQDAYDSVEEYERFRVALRSAPRREH